MCREITYMWRDKGLRIILLVLPLISLILFAATYRAQVLKDIPTVIVDLDHTKASQQLIDDIKNTDYLKVTAQPTSYSELESLINRGQAVVGVVIPENFGKNTALERSTNVLMIVDGTNIIYANTATSAMLSVTGTISAQIGIQTLLARGLTPLQARDAYLGVHFQEEPWFNPTLNYAYFLVLAFALNVWQQYCTLAACITIIGETGRTSWLQIRAAGFSRLKLFLCKSLVHIFIFMLMVSLIYGVAFGYYKMPLHCSLARLLLFTLFFVLALHGTCTLSSSLALNALEATRYGMIIALPAFILSGYTWPLEAMPRSLQHFVQILPQTWFFQGFNLLTFKNAGWPLMSHYFEALAVIAVVCYTLAAVITARKGCIR